MADEQQVPIYLSPDEDLTSVRERLEKVQARRIMLVIPPQTQLRSHVGWRLIHARMRELGKDLLVISPDRQVRSVARAAGFRVAESQDASSSRARPGGTRPGGIGTRARLASRGGSESRISRHPTSSQRRQVPGNSQRPLAPLPPPERDRDEDDEITLERGGEPQPLPEQSPTGNMPPLPGEFPAPASLPTIERPRINTTPAIRPSVPGRQDEDSEDTVEYSKDYSDYHTARRIRESASAFGAPESHPAPDPSPLERTWGSQSTIPSERERDIFSYMHDEPPPLSLPEQKGSMPGPFDEIGTNAPDISDRSTEIMAGEIEDLGDTGAITPPQISAIPTPLAPSREQSARPRRVSGQMRPHSPRAPRPETPGTDEDDELPFADQPTRLNRPSKELARSSQRPSQALKPAATTQRPSQALKPAATTQRPSQALKPAATTQRPSQALKPAATTQRPSQALRPGESAQQGGLRSSQALQVKSGTQTGQRRRDAQTATAGQRPPLLLPPPTPAATRQSRPSRRGSRALAIFFTILVLLLVVAGLLFYFIPTATVIISLQGQSYSRAVQLSASMNPSTSTPGTVQAQILEHDFTANDTGKATGQTSVGNARAQGQVTFTNNGNVDVTIPTGTIIATHSGIQFATSAEAFIPHGGSFPAVPISAQQTGKIGNVPANTITVIPQDSLNSIAQYSHASAQAINLTVNNPAATAGGGVQQVPAVTDKDLQTLKQTLHQDLQKQVNTWLSVQTHPGDLRGTPIPNILSSANPLAEEKFGNLPAVNQAANNGQFSGTVTLHIKVLMARDSAIKAAAATLLNAAARKMVPASMLAAQLPIALAKEEGKPSKDGTSLAISAQATGTVIRQVPPNINSLLAGKTAGSVLDTLKGNLPQAKIQNAQVSINPSFLGILPLQAERIRVILQPVQVTPPQNVPNG